MHESPFDDGHQMNASERLITGSTQVVVLVVVGGCSSQLPQTSGRRLMLPAGLCWACNKYLFIKRVSKLAGWLDECRIQRILI